MDDDIGIGQHFLYSVVTCITHGDIVGIASTPTFIPIDLTIVENHAVIGLVAHLYPFRFDALFFQSVQDLLRMAGNGGLHLFGCIVAPVFGLLLAFGVSKEVAVMEVDQDVESLLMGTLRFLQDISFVAPGTIAVALGIHPDTQTDGVHADLFQ